MKTRKFGVLLMIISIILGGCKASGKTDGTGMDEICNQYEVLQLTEEDVSVTYHGVEVKRDTGGEWLIDALGLPEGYEENNYGNISNGNGFRRWALSYPDYNEPEIRYLYLSEQEVDEDGQEIHGDGYLIGVYLNGIETARGIKVGASLEDVLEQYGRPDRVTEDGTVKIQYHYEDSIIEIELDESNYVKSIFINYNAEKADKEQGLI